MKIKQIKLTNYRNIESFDEHFHPHLNIFVGDNGQGKTNILEAISYLSSGRSFRVNQDKYLIKQETEFAKIESVFDNDETISVVLSDQGKYLSHNNQNIQKLSDFIGLSNVVLFNPDDIQFFTQAPRNRRKEIDYELGKTSKTYLQNLLQVNQLLQNRNAYLKHQTYDPIYLDTLDQQIADLSELLIIKRLEFTRFITDKSNIYYQKFTNSQDAISFTYESCVDLSKDNYSHALLAKMKEHRQRDLDLKMTNIGIHRDDFIFKVNDMHVVDVMSQGQRRMLMIAYKLATIDWFIEINKKVPIFCMDDLFSELDEEKRALVLKHLHQDLQIFITTTDLDFIQTHKDKHIFEIEKGKVRRSLNG